MRPVSFYLGVFLISFSTLMLEIIQTRILSVVVWYHLAFFVISLAMFGLTAGAVWVYLRGDRFTEGNLSYHLAYFSGLFALTTAMCLAVQMTLAPVMSRVLTTLWVWTELALCLAVPFFFSGVVMSLALTRSPFPTGWVYGIDLLGAAIGCLGALFLLSTMDGPSAILWAGVLAAAGSVLFSVSAIGVVPERKPPLHTWLWDRQWIFCVLFFAAMLNPLMEQGLQPIAVKGRFEFSGSHVWTKWNSLSRITVGPVRRGLPGMWGPSPKMYEKRWIVDHALVFIDGDAGTTAYRFDGNFDDVSFLKYDVTNIAYFLPGRERAVVIGIGGGRDVLSAALFGMKEITGVDINPIFVDLLTHEGRFGMFTNLSTLPGVRFVVDDGRNWLGRGDKSFDIIQMSLVDTWAATGAGAFTLSENGLYTVEAWGTAFARLSTNGVFTVSRWYERDTPEETGRLVSLAMATLLEKKIAEPRRHLYLLAQGRIATLVLSKSPFSGSDVEAMNRTAAEYQHEILIAPDVVPSAEVLYRIVSAENRKALYDYTASLEFDLTPPTDDRPFFFNQLLLSHPLQVFTFARSALGLGPEGGGVRKGNLVATFTLLLLFLIALILVVGTIVVPLRSALKDVGTALVANGTLYFGLIGAGFMMVEIGLMQRMSIFLGHPSYSLSVLLFTLILSTGLGSFLSESVPLISRGRMMVWGMLTGIYLSALPFCLELLLVAFEKAALTVRIAICVASIAPAGILLGFGFPSGMRLISAIDPKPTPWFWGINGAAGVFASIGAIVVSLTWGIHATLLVGALCYLLLIPVSFFLFRPQRVDASDESG
jgi:spermidine synthase